MERKAWLETFLRLVRTNGTRLDYRRELRLFPKELQRHLKNIGNYKEELSEIRAAEARTEALRDRLAKARAEKEKRRLKELARKAKKNAPKKLDGDRKEQARWEDDGGIVAPIKEDDD